MIGRSTQDDFNRRMDMHRQIGRLQEEVSRQKQTICSLRETLDGSVLKEDLAKHDRIFLDRIAVLETEIDDLKSGRAMQRAISAEQKKTAKAYEKCDSLRRQIGKLKSGLEVQKRGKEKYRQKWHDKDLELSQYRNQIKDLKMEIGNLNETIDAQNRVIADYVSRIDSLQHQKNKDHTDSSIPTSHDPIGSSAPRGRKHVSNSRTPSGKKPGKQPGAPGARRPQPSEADLQDIRTIECSGDLPFNPDERDENGNPIWVRTGNFRKRREVGFRVVREWKEYVSYEYKNIRTGEIQYSPFPPTIQNEVNYSPQYKAMLLYLQEACNVTPRKCAAFLGELFNKKGPVPSVGMTAGLPKMFSKKLDEYKVWKADRLLQLDGLHVDHTPVKMNGQQMQVLVVRHPREGTLYIVCKSKGLKDLDQTMLKQYVHTLIHDHATVFYHYGTGHQECLAHDLRYLKNAEELDKRLSWPSKMGDLIVEMIDAVNASNTNTVTKEQYDAFRKRYEEILALAESEYEKYPPSKYCKDGYNLAVRMKAYETDHLTFLLNPDVAPTNNEAEQAARKIKVLQRRKGTWRKYENIQYDCDIQMFLEDCRLRRLDPITMMAYVIATNGKVPEELNRNVSREDKVSSPESETESA